MTPRTVAAMGRIGGRTLVLGPVEVAITTPDAVVAVQSLDQQPVGRSRRVMISVGARSLAGPGDAQPFRTEPVEGSVLIDAPPGLRLRAWGAGSASLRPLAAVYRDGRYRLALEKGLHSSWLLLDARRQAQH